MTHRVQPTKAVLQHLGLKVPTIDQPLSDIDHELVKKAQEIPAKRGQGSTMRIRKVDDRTWYKVKIERYRGAVTHLKDDEFPNNEARTQPWWLCAAGGRESGGHKDFYREFENQWVRNGKTSDPWLPTTEDWERCRAEAAYNTDEVVKSIVATSIVRSTLSGKICGIELPPYGARAGILVRADNGQQRIACVFYRITSPTMIGHFLSLPCCDITLDWQFEPAKDGMFKDMDPGEMAFSADLPAEVLSEVLEKYSHEVDED